MNKENGQNWAEKHTETKMLSLCFFHIFLYLLILIKFNNHCFSISEQQAGTAKDLYPD